MIHDVGAWSVAAKNRFLQVLPQAAGALHRSCEVTNHVGGFHPQSVRGCKDLPHYQKQIAPFSDPIYLGNGEIFTQLCDNTEATSSVCTTCLQAQCVPPPGGASVVGFDICPVHDRDKFETRFLLTSPMQARLPRACPQLTKIIAAPKGVARGR